MIEEYKDYPFMKNPDELMESDDLVKAVVEKHNLYKPQFVKRRGSNNIPVYFGIFQDEIDQEDIKKMMDEAGYFVGSEREVYQDDVHITLLQFEPKNPEDWSDYLKRNFTTIYHWTPDYRVDQILKEGLIPKCENKRFSYPPRVYCLGDIIKEYIRPHGKVFCESNTDPSNNYKWTCLEIDFKSLPDDIKFQNDSNSEYSIYTESAIPPEYIKVKYHVDFKVYDPAEDIPKKNVPQDASIQDVSVQEIESLPNPENSETIETQ